MTKIAVVVLLGLVAYASAVALTTTCGKPVGGDASPNSTSATGGFRQSLCLATEYLTASSVTCGGAAAQGTPVTFTYSTKDSDMSGPLFFQIFPSALTTSTTKFHIKTTGPKLPGLFSNPLGYSQESDTINSKQPLRAADPIVGWVDAEHTYNWAAASEVVFAVSCQGNARTESFNFALWNGASTLEWDATGTVEGTYGAPVTAGVPCCGPVEVSWALNGVATEHQYIEAKVSQVAGKWASATMDNVSGFDDTQPFGNNGYGSAKVRTCVTNQSCTTEAKVYYIKALTAASSDVDGFVTLELTLRASAGVVGVSMATLAAVVLAHLF